MPDRFIERTLRAFSDDLSADAPTPGGGSAAAYAGAMGAALAAMVARITLKKEKSEELQSYIEKATSAKLPIITGEAPAQSPFIALGDTPAARTECPAREYTIARKPEYPGVRKMPGS